MLSPLAALAGITILNWQRPGLTTPANVSVAVAPPTWMTGSAGNAPNWEAEPSIRVVEGSPKQPGPFGGGHGPRRQDLIFVEQFAPDVGPEFL